jgi:hypothetical protein
MEGDFNFQLKGDFALVVYTNLSACLLSLRLRRRAGFHAQDFEQAFTQTGMHERQCHGAKRLTRAFLRKS